MDTYCIWYDFSTLVEWQSNREKERFLKSSSILYNQNNPFKMDPKYSTIQQLPLSISMYAIVGTTFGILANALAYRYIRIKFDQKETVFYLLKCDCLITLSHTLLRFVSYLIGLTFPSTRNQGMCYLTLISQNNFPKFMGILISFLIASIR